MVHEPYILGLWRNITDKTETSLPGLIPDDDDYYYCCLRPLALAGPQLTSPTAYYVLLGRALSVRTCPAENPSSEPLQAQDLSTKGRTRTTLAVRVVDPEHALTSAHAGERGGGS